ncbi:MAG TPA: family 16 glycoside hydrolase [Dictyobacter sp.]|jgi:hypothetical protein|nr:family 16 glycoside hydrolase [Dictyobacter sp.]
MQQSGARNGQDVTRKTPLFLGMVMVVALLGSGIVGYALMQNVPGDSSWFQGQSVSVAPTEEFADQFVDNRNHWNVQREADRYAVAITHEHLVLHDMNNSLLPVVLPTNMVYSNFRLAVDATLDQGDANNGYGIYIRAASAQDGGLATFYRLELYGDRTYAIFKGNLDANGNPQPEPEKLVDYTYQSAIQPQGHVNHMLVVANGSSITLIVNGQTLKTLTDTTYTDGELAFFVSNIQHASRGAQASFSHLAIYPVNN